MDEVINSAINDELAMEMALCEAEKGIGFVSPNPPVGCVILDCNNHFLSKGYHERFGGPHAEINALKGLTEDQLKGARVFVTLEPCAHYGKTPPCAEALARLPISEVIYGLQDPNPLVQGKGLEKLARAGIKVTHYNKNNHLFEKVCEHFLKNMREKRPFVTLKAAVSLDGKLALKNGQSQWITGEKSRLEAHKLRAVHDAILVGVKTFLSDNPSLNIRHPEFNNKTNKIIIIDPSGRGLQSLKESKLYKSHKPENIFWAMDKENESEYGIENKEKILNQWGVKGLFVSKIQGSQGKTSTELNLPELLKELWSHKIGSILVEGGGSTLSAFINQKVADRISLFVAPTIIGDKNGIGWTSNLNNIEKLEQAMSLGLFSCEFYGKDLLISVNFNDQFRQT